MAENPRIIDLPSTNTLNQDDSLMVDHSSANCRRIEMSNLLKQIQSSIDVKSEYLSINGNNQMQSNLKMNNKKIIGLANGTEATDAVTVGQVSEQINSLNTSVTGDITGIKSSVANLQTQVNNINNNELPSVKNNVEQLRGQLNQLVSLARSGTRNGNFKFTPKKGVKGNAIYILSGTSPRRHEYFSGPVLDSVKNHYSDIPINTNTWFYVSRWCAESDKTWAFDDIWVGYLTNPNNINSIEWWSTYLWYDIYGNPTEWSDWSKSISTPWYTTDTQRWEAA